MTVGAALPTLTGTVTGLANGDTLGTTIAGRLQHHGHQQLPGRYLSYYCNRDRFLRR